MSEKATNDPEEPAEKDRTTVVDDGLKSNQNENQESVTSRETETSELNTGEIVSGCTAEVESDISSNRSEAVAGDEQYQPRNASVSLISDSTESNFVIDEGKQDNLPAVRNCQNVTAAGKSEKPNIPATEIDPFTQSVKYLEKHQILRLFQNFAAQIVYKRPENPLQYLVEELERRRGEIATDSSTDSQNSALLS